MSSGRSSPASARFLGGRRDDDDFRALGQFRGGIARFDAVDRDLSRLDQRLEPGARKREPPLARRVAEESVEPLARLPRADLEIERRLRRRRATGRSAGAETTSAGSKAAPPDAARLEARLFALAFT